MGSLLRPMCSSWLKRVEHAWFTKDESITDLPVSMIRLSNKSQKLSVRIRRILTLRRGETDTDICNIRDCRVFRGGARGPTTTRGAIRVEPLERLLLNGNLKGMVADLGATTTNESFGAVHVVLIEVADSFVVHLALNGKGDAGAISHSNDRSDRCGSHSQSQAEGRKEGRSEHVWTRGGREVGSQPCSLYALQSKVHPNKIP